MEYISLIPKDYKRDPRSIPLWMLIGILVIVGILLLINIYYYSNNAIINNQLNKARNDASTAETSLLVNEEVVRLYHKVNQNENLINSIILNQTNSEFSTIINNIANKLPNDILLTSIDGETIYDDDETIKGISVYYRGYCYDNNSLSELINIIESSYQFSSVVANYAASTEYNNIEALEFEIVATDVITKTQENPYSEDEEVQ